MNQVKQDAAVRNLKRSSWPLLAFWGTFTVLLVIVMCRYELTPITQIVMGAAAICGLVTGVVIWACTRAIVRVVEEVTGEGCHGK